MSERVIECVDLQRSFRGFRLEKKTVLDGLDLQVLPGECYTLMGRNGCGKSTLIKLLLNLIKPGGGEASVQGTPTHRLNHRHFRQIGYVTAEHDLPKMQRVGSYLKQLAPLYPTWDVQFEKDLLKQFDLDPNQRIHALSRGMRTQVSFISAIAYRPSLLILDEPFSGLDALVRDELISGILDLMESENWTIFMASHDFDEVEKLADRIGFLQHGKIGLTKTVDQLCSNYAKVRVSFSSPPSFDIDKLPVHWIDKLSSNTDFSFVDSNFTNRAKTKAEVAEHLGPVTQFDVMPHSLRDTFVSIARESKL